MKQFALFFTVYLASISISFSQTTTVAINKQALCCNGAYANFDVDDDSINDFQIIGKVMVDIGLFEAKSINSVFKLTSIKTYNETYPNSYGSSNWLAAGTIGCSWDARWQPNTGLRYMGYMKLNGPNDTTFGWVSLDFKGDYNCNDTVFIIEATKSITSNNHLFAGEKHPVGIRDIDIQNNIKIYPNPITNGLLSIESKVILTQIEIYNLLGEIVKQCVVSSKQLSIDVSELPTGMYMLHMKTHEGSLIRKVLVQ